MTKKALIKDGEVDAISFVETSPDWVDVPDDVFAGFVNNGDGTYSQPAPPPVSTAEVDVEKDRRINAGFMFGGTLFQSEADDRENIQGAYSTAFSSIVFAGVQPGNLRWSDPDTDFGWIAADNSLVPMDAHTVLAFGNTAKQHKQGLIFAARAIKDDVENGVITTIEEVSTDPRWP